MATNETTPTSISPVAVVGATGQQGRAVVAALLDVGVRVRALVRDPESEASRNLAAESVELVRADLDDAASLRAAFAGTATVFAMTTFAGPDGPAGEVVQGRTIGDAAAAAGVSHLVYSSVGGAERSTGIPHFESKRRVEEHLETLDLQTTFVRPVFFMDNFATFAQPSVEEDGALVVRLPLPDGIALQLVAVRDIGRTVAVAVVDPDRIVGGAIEIAGDELTGSQIAAAFGAASGRPARYEALPADALHDDDQEAMFDWFTRLPAYQADFAATRDLVPDRWDLPTWIARH